MATPATSKGTRIRFRSQTNSGIPGVGETFACSHHFPVHEPTDDHSSRVSRTRRLSTTPDIQVLPNRATEPKKKMPDIHHQLRIDSPVNVVFDAFTTPAGLNAWWTLESDGAPVLHSDYRLYFGPEYDWITKVIQVELNRGMTWSPVRVMEDWMPTQFGFELLEADGATTVRFFHSGWEDSGGHFGITNYCWGQLLKGLKDYVEHGIIVPFDQRN